jgi:hypothetical protein
MNVVSWALTFKQRMSRANRVAMLRIGEKLRRMSVLVEFYLTEIGHNFYSGKTLSAL